MGIVDRLLFRNEPKSWVKTMEELNQEFDRVDEHRAQQARKDEEMDGLFKSQDNAQPAPAFIHPAHRRWFFCGMGASAAYFALYGIGPLPS